MRVSLLLLSVLLVTVVYSVTECHHEKILEKHFEENPGAWEEHQELMKRSMELSRSKRALSEAADLVRIPVVFHVFFTTSNMDMRLTTEAIEQELIYINDWFNNRNVYFSNSSPFWVDDIATADDMKIQIELAGFDPNGDPTTGIVYYEVDDSFDCSDISQVTSTSEGGIDNWDPFSYMNFRTCDLTGFGAGYASVPLSNSNPATDTVVITYDQIGNPTYSGSTGAHEIGHWLGLYHTFGAGDGCSTTDFVDDTPVTSMPMANFVINNNLGHCPGDDGATDATFITCTEPAMAQNVMDYNFEECISYFSKGQAALMREWLDSDNLGSIRFALRQTAGLADLVTPSSTPAASPSASATRTAAASVSSTSAASASSTSGASASSTPVSSVSSTSGASASSTPDAVVASVSSTSAASASSTSGASASSTPDAVVASVSSTSGASASSTPVVVAASASNTPVASASSTPVVVAASASNTPVASASSTSAASASSITGVITSASSTPAASASSTSAASASQSTAQEYDDDDDVDYSVETRNLYTDDDDDDDSSVDSDDESLYSTIASDDDDDIVVVTVETNYLYTDDDDDESSDSTLEISSDDDDESSDTSDDDGDDDSPLSSNDDDNSSSSASSHFPMGELIMMTTLFAFI